MSIFSYILLVAFNLNHINFIEAASKYSAVVKTTAGLVGGQVLPSAAGNGRYFSQYLGIRYAKPPIDSLRFRAPLPVKPYEGILDGTLSPNACPQPSAGANAVQLPNAVYHYNLPLSQQSEDCLNCNVYKPLPYNVEERYGCESNSYGCGQSLLPILIFFHGGSFLSGANSIDLYNASTLAVASNSIVAVCNYRLGILGFLKLDVPGITGNQGLKDQALAIEFIYRNALHFGGDADRITLLGDSAGASSVHYQLMSNSPSRELFQRGMLMSGTATALYAYTAPEAAKQGWRACINGPLKANLTTSSDVALHNYLANQTWQELYSLYGRAAAALLEVLPGLCSPVPTVDGEFLTDDPYSLMLEGKFKRTPLYAGTTNAEALGLILFLFDPITVATQAPNFKLSLPVFEALLNLAENLSGGKITAAALLNIYGNGSIPADDNARYRFAVAATSDLFFTQPLKFVLQNYLLYGVPAYPYLFSHVSSLLLYGVPIGNAAGHVDDVPYWFGHPLERQKYNYTDEEARLSQRMINRISNFARTGSPTPNAVPQQVEVFSGDGDAMTVNTRADVLQVIASKLLLPFFVRST